MAFNTETAVINKTGTTLQVVNGTGTKLEVEVATPVNTASATYQVYSNANMTLGSDVEIYNMTTANSTITTIKQFVINCSDLDLFQVDFTVERLGTDEIFLTIFTTNSESIALNTSVTTASSLDDILIKVTRIGAGSANVKIAVAFTVV